MMQVSLKDLTYINETDLFKIIISSADQFPGLYRFASGWKVDQNYEEIMKLINFMEACHKTELGLKWNKEKWLSMHDVFFDQNFGSHGRNNDRSDKEIGDLLKQKARDLIVKSNSFSLVVIDTFTPVMKIQLNSTYYMMGSLLYFGEDDIKVSYDSFTQDCHTKLSLTFQDATNYIYSTFSEHSISKLFYRAEIIGKLYFDSSGVGSLDYNPDQLNSLLSDFSPGSTIFGCVNYDYILPIRFAKLIGVSNVCK